MIIQRHCERKRMLISEVCENKKIKKAYDYFYYLPEEIILKIFRLVNERELTYLQLSCKRFARLASDKSLWQRLYFRKFNLRIPLQLTCDSKKEYFLATLYSKRRFLSLSHLGQPKFFPRIKFLASTPSECFLSEDGCYLLSCLPGAIKMTGIATNEEKKFFIEEEILAQHIAFSPNREFISAVAMINEKKFKLYIWNVTTRERYFLIFDKPVNCCFSYNGLLLSLFLEAQSEVLLYQLPLDGPLLLLKHVLKCNDLIDGLFFSRDSVKLGAITAGCQVVIFDCNSGKKKRIKINGTSAVTSIYSIIFIANTYNLAIITQSCLLTWNELTQQLSTVPCADARFSPDGLKVALFTENNDDFLLIDLLNPTFPINLFNYFNRELAAYCFSNKYLLAIHVNGKIFCLDIENKHMFDCDLSPSVYQASLSGLTVQEFDGGLFISVGKNLYIWNLMTKVIQKIFQDEELEGIKVTNNCNAIAKIGETIINMEFALHNCEQLEVHFSYLDIPDDYGKLLSKFLIGNEYFLLFESAEVCLALTRGSLYEGLSDDSPSSVEDLPLPSFRNFCNNERLVAIYNPIRKTALTFVKDCQVKISFDGNHIGLMHGEALEILSYTGGQKMFIQPPNLIDFNFISNSQDVALLVKNEVHLLSPCSIRTTKLLSEGQQVFSDPSGEYIFVKGSHYIDIYDINTLRIKKYISCFKETDLAFSPKKGQYLLVDSLYAKAKLYVLNGKEVNFNVAGPLKKWAFFSSGSYLLTITERGWVQHWCCQAGTCLKEYSIAALGCQFIDVSRDGLYIITAAEDPRSLILWETHSGRSFPLEGDFLSYRKDIVDVFFLPKRDFSIGYEIICVTSLTDKQLFWQIAFVPPSTVNQKF